MNRLSRLAAIAAVMLLAPLANADERLAVGVSYVQDGSCGSDGLMYLDASTSAAAGRSRPMPT